MSDVNRTQVIYGEESVAFGTLATSGKVLRLVSGSLRQDTNTVVSQEIRADRQEADLIRVGLQGAGDIGVELSFGAHDDLMLAAMQSAGFASEAADTNVTVSFASRVTVGGNYARLTRAAGDWNTTFAVNDIIKVGVTNIAVPANAVFAVVQEITSATVMLIKFSDLVDSPTDVGITIQRLGGATNGVDFDSFSFEGESQDLTTDFTQWLGYSPDTMSLNITPEAIITGSFGFLGKKELSATASFDATPTAAASNDVMSAVANVIALVEGGDPSVILDATEFTLAVANNLAARLKIGLLGALSIRSGTFGCTGTLKAYYSGPGPIDKYLNFLGSELFVVAQDAAGNAYAYYYPKVKYTSGQRPLPGINQDRMTDLAWRAIRHPTQNITMKLAKGTVLV